MTVKEVGVKPLEVMKETGNTEPSLIQIVNAPRAPRVTDRRYNIGTKWVDFGVNPLPANVYELVDFVGGDAIWMLEINGSSGNTASLLDSSGNKVIPESSGANVGAITINAAAVPQHGVPVETVKSGTSLLEIDIQQAGISAAADPTQLGLAAFDSSSFISTNGFISLIGGGQALEGVDVDLGTSPVTPDPVTGNLLITGNQVAASTIGNHVIRTNGTGAHTATIEIQRTTTSGVANVSKNGVAHFNEVDFTVDGAGFVSLATPAVMGSGNIGIAYAAPTFTVQGDEGAPLSVSNPGFITLQDRAVPGQLKTYTVTANQTFTDGNAGTTVGALLGLIATQDWASVMPVYLYAVGNDAQDTINFMISRNPAAKVAPAAAAISKIGTIVNVGQGDFFSLGNVVVADYDGNPCLCLGSFRMTYTAAGTFWTVAALNATDGIGNFHEETLFTLPAGTNNSEAATWFQAAAGETCPQFTTEHCLYTINRSGECFVDHYHSIATVAGVGASELRATLPYRSSNIASLCGEYIQWNAGANNQWYCHSIVAGGTLYTAQFVLDGAAGVGSQFVNASIGLSDALYFTFHYKAF